MPGRLTGGRLLGAVLLLTTVATAAAPEAYREALRAAGILTVDDPAEPRRWYVDYQGRENDWRITVYVDDENVYLSALILEVPPGEGDGPPAKLGEAMARLALRRNFDLPRYKYALHPDERRLYLVYDPPVGGLEPARLPALLAEMVAVLEAESRRLRESFHGG